MATTRTETTHGPTYSMTRAIGTTANTGRTVTPASNDTNNGIIHKRITNTKKDLKETSESVVKTMEGKMRVY